MSTDMHQLVERQQAAALERLRMSLPLTDPDRHALDTDADRRFAALATNNSTRKDGSK